MQSSITVREGVDSIAEVCFRILSPPQSDIDPIAVFALVNVEPFEGTAQGMAIIIASNNFTLLAIFPLSNTLHSLTLSPLSNALHSLSHISTLYSLLTTLQIQLCILQEKESEQISKVLITKLTAITFSHLLFLFSQTILPP